MVPIAWALMENKLAGSYDNLFNHLKQQFPELDPPVITSDFELSMRKSIRQIFPDAKLLGCYFHYAQVSNNI